MILFGEMHSEKVLSFSLIPFSSIYRVESFIEHQDACTMGRLRSDSHPIQAAPPACLSRTASSPSPSSDTNLSAAPWASRSISLPKPMDANLLTSMHSMDVNTPKYNPRRPPDLELQLLTKSTNAGGVDIAHNSNKFDEEHSTQLQLSIGSSEIGDKIEADNTNVLNCRTPVGRYSPRGSCSTSEKPSMVVPQTPRYKFYKFRLLDETCFMLQVMQVKAMHCFLPLC